MYLHVQHNMYSCLESSPILANKMLAKKIHINIFFLFQLQRYNCCICLTLLDGGTSRQIDGQTEGTTDEQRDKWTEINCSTQLCTLGYTVQCILSKFLQGSNHFWSCHWLHICSSRCSIQYKYMKRNAHKLEIPTAFISEGKLSLNTYYVLKKVISSVCSTCTECV